MKRSKPKNSRTNSSPRPPRQISPRAQLRELQRVMASALFRPLTPQWGMQKRRGDGVSMEAAGPGLLKPDDRLRSFVRLETYNHPYWVARQSCLYGKSPGLGGGRGKRK